MIRSKYMSGIVWLVLLLTLQVWPGMVKPAHGQGTRKDDIVFNSRGVPLAGATVRICAMPASGQPCTPLALIYSDPGLTQALANPTTTDGLGNYFFYAAPGKYEVEISGPGITTKQLPNVIVPSDPSSPTFSSVSTSGGINAFSLSLTGNLTVNGSTTVVGNLASGTLNLSNQGTAPGTPGAGTINLYTKSVDKRLYYKDETGTEIGPIASSSGAQTNVANTFTAAQTIDADFHTKGPNPSYDILRYGGYEGPNYATGTTGSITSGSATLTLASALDFANGQGVLVLGAGAAPTIPTPDVSTSSAVAVGATGSTTYNYCIVDEDYAGGRTACSAAVQVTNAVATLGLQNYTIASCSRATGVTTCTTTATHHIISGAQIEIQHSTTADPSFEGAFTTTSASGSTITFNQYGIPDATGTVTSGTLRVAGRVALRWKANTANSYSVLKHRIYRCTATCTLPANAANYSYIGTAVGFDTYFVDAGYPVTAATTDNGDVPATAPTVASNKWLSTTITNGGGSTTLTLAANAGNTVSGASVFHDNTPNILNLCQNTPTGGGSNQGAQIFIPSPTNSANIFPIASTLNLGLCPSQVEIDIGGQVYLASPIIPKGLGAIKGVASGNSTQTTNFYGLGIFGNVIGNAYPMFYMLPGTSTNSLMQNLIIHCSRSYQSCIYADLDTTGGGETSVRYADVHTTGGAYSTSYVQKGGFGYYWDRGGWGTISQDFSSPPAALFTVNCGNNQSGQLLPGILYTEHTYAFGGVVSDSCGVSLQGLGTGGNWRFTDMLFEGSYGPAFRLTGGTGAAFALDFITPTYADFLGGASAPFLDVGINTAGIRVIHPFCGSGYQPVFGTITGVNYQGIEIDSGFGGCSYTGLKNVISHDRNNSIENYSNANINLQNASRIFNQMAVPAIAQSAVVSAGGAVPVGLHTYNLTAVDFDGGETTFGPPITATATTGNQTVTLTMPVTFPPGAAGLNIYRDGVLSALNSCFAPQATVPGAAIADTAGFACGNSQPLVNSAGASALSSNGVAGFKVRIGGEALTAAPRSEQNLFLPGALTSTWTSSTWTLDKAVTVTRIQAQAKTAPVTCSPNAILRLTDGTTPANLTVAAAANDSGAITQNYAAGSVLTFSVQTAAAGCGTSPADVNVTIQYRMQ